MPTFNVSTAPKSTNRRATERQNNAKPRSSRESSTSVQASSKALQPPFKSHATKQERVIALLRRRFRGLLSHYRVQTVSIAAELRRAGRGKRIIVGEQDRCEINLGLVRLIREVFAARHELLPDSDESTNAITARLRKSKGHMTSLLRVSYLAPSIVEDILQGRQPVELSGKRRLRLSKDLPLEWAKQRKTLGFA